VKGKLISSGGGLPLPGVNVIVKGTNNSTTTDVDGKFALDFFGLLFPFFSFFVKSDNCPA
jgi:hypothetical protein